MVKTDYITIAEAAEKWEISVRQVQNLCKGGNIEGALRFGHAWMIPKDAQKPQDGRTRAARENKTVENKSDENACLPMPRKSPFLDMTDLYTVPGTADEVIDSLRDNPEAFARFKALHKGLSEGRMKLHNSLLSRSVSGGLSVRQREMCRLAAFGLSYAEIAARMNVSVSHAKKELYNVKNKTGAMNRRELGAFV